MSFERTQLKPQIDQLIGVTLHAVDPAEAIRRHVSRDGVMLHVDGTSYDTRGYDEVVLVSVGKAAVPMANAAYELIEDKLSNGVVVTKYGHLDATSPLLREPRMVCMESAHPVPDEQSLAAGERVIAALAHCTPRTLVLACISGGASALMISPHPGIRLRTMQAINDALLRCGADIREMNLVRSHLERLKDGGLVRLAQPGQVLGLILSDVIGDPLDVIASGLTNEPRAHNVLVANNAQACAAAAQAAAYLGYQPQIVTTELRGEARERGREIALAILQAPAHTCLIYGGEPTVTLRGQGKGGRNQELALAAALELHAQADSAACIIALGTDGTDGPTDAAGALALPDTVARARALGLDAADHLARNDSYPFFAALGDLLMTGPTGTNVADVIIALRGA
jgi:hydroxypyruvate reductase